VPHDTGLVGHSDADVGMHALTDAIYGALAEGDIGRHFPPSDPQWKGADSEIFLAHARGWLRARLSDRQRRRDADLRAARRSGPTRRRCEAGSPEIIGSRPGRISVKATTSERLGFTGRGEGIAALATVTLVAP
jgi:2-C-methyl-D-erythritol 4-phosphate cytidylyltransferase / 2-C-methyl-D-erythritol 2,4-cyclodiphosphate synthase